MAFSLESARIQLIKVTNHCIELEEHLKNYVDKHNNLFFLMTMHGVALAELLDKLVKKGIITDEERKDLQDSGRKVLEEINRGPAQGQDVAADGGIIGGVSGSAGEGVHNGSPAGVEPITADQAAPTGDEPPCPVQ